MSLRERLNLSRLAIKYSRITLCFWLAVVVAGIFAFCSLKYALFPDVTFPVVIVNAQSPLDTVVATETQLTKPIENSLQSLDGVDDISSSTYRGQSVISLAFTPGGEIATATEAVKNNLQKLSLPKDAEWKVIPFNLNESTAISYALKSNNLSLRELTQIAQTKIIPVLEKLPGVLRIDLLGNSSSLDNNQPKSSLSNLDTLVRFNQQDVIALQVIKNSNANTLEVVTQVEKVIHQLEKELTDVELVIAETQANYIREATYATIEALLGAIILAILVVFPFLRSWRATLITALAIPISLLGTFIVMKLAGFNLETLTLLALALTIGIVIDDAIVDVENIMRHIEAGETPRQAAMLATDEIGLTVSASTLTIVSVFVPIAFLGGTLGQFFRPFGLTVSAAVLISLLVARTLSPVLAVYWLKSTRVSRENQSTNHTSSISNSYRNLLSWSLNHRPVVIAIAIISFIAGIALIPFIPQGFIPKLDRGEFNVVYTTPLPKLATRLNNVPANSANSAESGEFSWIKQLTESPNKILLRKTRSIGEELETKVLEIPEVESVYTIAGIRGEPTKGQIYIKLKSDRDKNTSAIQEEVRKSLTQLPGVTVSVEDILFVETGNDTPIKIALFGDDLNTLTRTANELKNQVEKLSGLVDVQIKGADGDNISIEHSNGKRVAYLTANLSEGQALGNATEKILAISKSILPTNINLKIEGDSARADKILGEFSIALILAIICMLGLLIFLFGRLLEPMIVGLSLPLSLVGAMLALLVTQSDFGMISLIGLIFLLGLLDKNAILLIDYANQLRQSGLERMEAILITGTVRLRPIIMTTASTILGMLPLALGWGAGAELRQPMAVAIIGGLITSSLLSLIAVPVLYTLLEDWWLTIFPNSQV
jgi:multidrug efflux pump subunit AcrB